MRSSDQYEAYVRGRGIAPTSMHLPDCQGSKTVLASYPAQDGGVSGCTCGVSEKFAAVFAMCLKATDRK